MNTKNTAWLIDGSLVYKLDETGTRNFCEVNITMADGSRKEPVRQSLAERILALLSPPAQDEQDRLGAARYRRLRQDSTKWYVAVVSGDTIDTQTCEELDKALDAHGPYPHQAEEELFNFRVWPDGTVQSTDEPAHSHMSDDFMIIAATDEDDAGHRAMAPFKF